jgi:hypothetical protein
MELLPVHTQDPIGISLQDSQATIIGKVLQFSLQHSGVLSMLELYQEMRRWTTRFEGDSVGTDHPERPILLEALDLIEG